MATDAKSYADRESERVRAYQAKQRAISQDVYEQFGDILDRGPENPERRDKAAKSLAYTCETYGGHAFHLKWSPNHIKVIDRIEAAVLQGLSFAFAMPRGSGKTTIARWGVLWAILNGFSTYSVLVGATQKSADRLIKNIKSTLRFNELLCEDYPEVGIPVKHIKGEARRATGQKFQGEPTMIEWGKSQIVLPNIPLPYCKCSSSIIDVTGIEGDMRGRQYERPDGTIARPSLVLLDDPQTRESAKSPSQCSDREDIIAGDIKFMVGPDETLGVVIPCTVIKRGDLAYRLLDRDKHPDYHGETTRMLESFPERLDLWEEYREMQVESFMNGGAGEEATEYYKANQLEMDQGGIASWPEKFAKKRGEISAIQHAMNLYLTDEDAFFAECQNDPRDGQDASASSLDPEEIAARMVNVKQGVVPGDSTILTAFIDISKKVLWYSACAWEPDFTGAIIDYGVWPNQKTRYVTLESAKVTMQSESPGKGLEASLLHGLRELVNELAYKDWKTETGSVMHIERILIDEGWEQKVVHEYCRRSPHKAIIMPSKGIGIKARDLIDPSKRPKPGEKRGDHWRINPNRGSVRGVVFDTDHWKSFMANRFQVEKNDSGAMTIYQVKSAASQHRMLLEQLTAEYGSDVTYESTGKTRTHWALKPGQSDNHLWDTVVGNAVAASMQGAVLRDLTGANMEKKKVTGSIVQAARDKHAKRHR